MAITYDRVIQEILKRLGAVTGSNPASADSNYTATPSTSTVIGPDFVPSMVQDALAAALGLIVEAIASTPLNPERAGFTTQTSALASGVLVPRTDSGGSEVIGVIGAVRDSSNSEVLILTDLDKVRSFVKHAATIYDDFTPSWYALDGQRIIHTRTNVVIDVCTYTRPTVFSGDISLDDWHESGLVNLAVREIALTEDLFASLYTAANTAGEAHLTEIRNYGNPAWHGEAQAASSPT